MGNYFTGFFDYCALYCCSLNQVCVNRHHVNARFAGMWAEHCHEIASWEPNDATSVHGYIYTDREYHAALRHGMGSIWKRCGSLASPSHHLPWLVADESIEGEMGMNMWVVIFFFFFNIYFGFHVTVSLPFILMLFFFFYCQVKSVFYVTI